MSLRNVLFGFGGDLLHIRVIEENGGIKKR